MAKPPNQTNRFRTYKNYIVSFSRLISAYYPELSDLASLVSHLKGFQAISRRSVNESDEIAKLLRASWYTEILLTKQNQYLGLLPYAVPWSMVESYYAIYTAVRAYHLAFNNQLSKPSHEATIEALGNNLVGCKDRFPPPWRCVYNGLIGSVPFNLDNTICTKDFYYQTALFSPYSNEPCQHYALFLKTTHRNRIVEMIDNFKNSSRPRIKRIRRTIRDAKIIGMRPTNFMDALYRLRTRSNYKDIDSFVFSQSNTQEYLELQRCIVKTLEYNLLLFEMMIAKSLGVHFYIECVTEFIAHPYGKQAKVQLLERANLIDVSLRTISKTS